MAGGWESTLQRQHEVPALLGGTALPGRPRQLAEVGKMVPQPGPELQSALRLSPAPQDGDVVGEELQHRLQAPPGTVLAAAVMLLSGLGNKFPKAVAQLQPSYAPVEIHWRSWGPSPVVSHLAAITRYHQSIAFIMKKHPEPCRNGFIQSLAGHGVVPCQVAVALKLPADKEAQGSVPPLSSCPVASDSAALGDGAGPGLQAGRCRAARMWASRGADP